MKSEIKPIPDFSSLQGLEPHQIRKVILEATPRDWRELFDGMLDGSNIHIHQYWLRNVLTILRLVRSVEDSLLRMRSKLGATVIGQHKFGVEHTKQAIEKAIEPLLEAGDLKVNGIGWKTVVVIVVISCIATFGITKAYMDRHPGPVPFRLIASPVKGCYTFEPLPDRSRDGSD
jgi:hypothetical protein